MRKDPDMLEEYDFSQGVRGKYAKRYAEGTNVVVIDPDLAEYFPDQDSVNASLRGLVEIIKRREKAERQASPETKSRARWGRKPLKRFEAGSQPRYPAFKRGVMS
jgi:hypothetical protein